MRAVPSHQFLLCSQAVSRVYGLTFIYLFFKYNYTDGSACAQPPESLSGALVTATNFPIP